MRERTHSRYVQKTDIAYERGCKEIEIEIRVEFRWNSDRIRMENR